MAPKTESKTAKAPPLHLTVKETKDLLAQGRQKALRERDALRQAVAVQAEDLQFRVGSDAV